MRVLIAYFLAIAATKEWVIPAKPKPGRKPKKDTTSPVTKDSDEVSETLAILFVIVCLLSSFFEKSGGW